MLPTVAFYIYDLDIFLTYLVMGLFELHISYLNRFRSLFLEDVKELELKEAKVSAFKIFLRYLYSARISLKDLDVETVLDITKLAQKYTVGELESALLQYLKSVLNPENLCTIFDAVHANCSSDFYQFCLEYADRNAGSVLKSDSFPLMSTVSVK